MERWFGWILRPIRRCLPERCGWFSQTGCEIRKCADVKEEQDRLMEYSAIETNMESVRRDSVFLTVFLPTLVVGAVVVIVFMMMNRQAGGGNAKMMNFGKSRARMITPDAKRVTFKDVAGLQEEKEELEEIVDFLEGSSEIHSGRSQNSQGSSSGRPSGNGENPAGQGHRR